MTPVVVLKLNPAGKGGVMEKLLAAPPVTTGLLAEISAFTP
jgi:hypothetical protein